MNVTIITAITDHYDPLPPVCPQQGVDVEWVCVTDDPALAGPGWRTVHVPRSGPARDAAYPAKITPWWYTNAPVSIWLDAAIHVTSPTFVAEVLPYATPLAQYAHPDRDCAYDEIQITAQMSRYAGNRYHVQAAEYRHAGFPPHWGLWGGGVIVRRHTTQVRAHGEAWATEVARWPGGDQQTEPYVCWTTGLRPNVLPGWIGPPWFDHRPSPRHFSA